MWKVNTIFYLPLWWVKKQFKSIYSFINLKAKGREIDLQQVLKYSRPILLLVLIRDRPFYQESNRCDLKSLSFLRCNLPFSCYRKQSVGIHLANFEL